MPALALAVAHRQAQPAFDARRAGKELRLYLRDGQLANGGGVALQLDPPLGAHLRQEVYLLLRDHCGAEEEREDHLFTTTPHEPPHTAAGSRRSV